MVRVLGPCPELADADLAVLASVPNTPLSFDSSSDFLVQGSRRCTFQSSY